MSNWILRLGSALSTLGLSVAAIDPSYSKAGLFIAAGGAFFKVLFPETEGGELAKRNIIDKP
jgi:hypothetical protein